MSAALQVTASARSFTARRHRLLIDGKFVDAASGKTFETYDPATGDVLASIAEADRPDVDRAVQAARRAFESGPWPQMTPSERSKRIWKLADLIETHGDELALSADLLRYMAGWATKIEGATIPISVPGHVAWTLREPVGVVAQIIPWNFPLLMAAWKLGPALAAGCTVVLKPAEQTPLTAMRLAELVCEAGFPPGVVNVLPGYGETAGAALAAHPGVDKVAFTGSTEVGKLIVQAAAGNLKKVSLELGGKSPNIVFADADLDAAASGSADAIFFNHGQCCCAGSRLYVEKPAFERVVDTVSQRAKAIRVGPGLDPATEMGPLVSKEQLERVCGYLDSGSREGARAVAGGGRVGDRGYFVAPTVLVDTKPKMKVVQEEIFGPVVTVIPFSDPADLIATANDTMYGLAAGVWTRDIGRAHQVARSLRAGTVWINCYNVFDAALPFGGFKQSGWGREMGKEALELYTEVKSVCAKL
jgi:phenylacetaldehyde dehydrogenase